jgi:hypothetical protein
MSNKEFSYFFPIGGTTRNSKMKRKTSGKKTKKKPANIIGPGPPIALFQAIRRRTLKKGNQAELALFLPKERHVGFAASLAGTGARRSRRTTGVQKGQESFAVAPISGPCWILRH